MKNTAKSNATRSHHEAILTNVTKNVEYAYKPHSTIASSGEAVNGTMGYFTALLDTDEDGLHDAEEDYGWTVARDINGDGDTDDNIYSSGILYYKETLLPYGEGGEIWSSWTDPDSDNNGYYDTSTWCEDRGEAFPNPLLDDNGDRTGYGPIPQGGDGYVAQTICIPDI